MCNFFTKVLDEYTELRAQWKWHERKYSVVWQNVFSALENTSGYDPEVLLKRLPPDALQEEPALLR